MFELFAPVSKLGTFAEANKWSWSERKKKRTDAEHNFTRAEILTSYIAGSGNVRLVYFLRFSTKRCKMNSFSDESL